MRSFILFIFFITSVSAMNNDQSNGWIGTRLDSIQNYWSRKVVLFSSNLDATLSTDENETKGEPDAVALIHPIRDVNESIIQEADEAYGISMGFDDFFKNERYLDLTNRSYVKLRGGYEYDQRGESDFFNRISARIKLPKTQKKLQLFIGREADSLDPLMRSNQSSGDNGIGVKYYMNSLIKGLLANGSIGLSGIDNPYLKTHFEYPIYIEHWIVRPMQTFRYSVEEKFDEWSNVYFDCPMDEKEMFRLVLERSTNSEIRGMAYRSNLSWLKGFEYDSSGSVAIGVNGRTKDLASHYLNGMHPQEGVYEYTAALSWRQKIWKDYVYYQIDPVLSWHEQYHYKPNPMIRINLEIFFGNFD